MMTRRAAGALLVLVVTGCAPQLPAVYALTPPAMQRPHPQGVPHVDLRGAVVQRFEPQQSLLVLALGGVLVDYQRGVARGFADAFAADFNAVAADPGQPLPALLRAAEGSRVRLLRPQSDEADSPALLDAAAAVIAVPRDPARIDDFALAARQQHGKPVWALLPAHATTLAALPNPAPTQALAFAALIHGASGLIWQGEDNYAARNAGMLGISPAPRLDYGITTESNGTGAPRIATPAEAAASKRLWETVAQLNRRLARLKPALLQPDASLQYSVAIAASDEPLRPPLTAPVRTALKPWDGGLLLIAVNLERRSHNVRIDFGEALRGMARGPGDETYGPLEGEPARGLVRDRIEAYGVRLYRLVP